MRLPFYLYDDVVLLVLIDLTLEFQCLIECNNWLLEIGRNTDGLILRIQSLPAVEQDVSTSSSLILFGQALNCDGSNSIIINFIPSMLKIFVAWCLQDIGLLLLLLALLLAFYSLLLLFCVLEAFAPI